MTIRVFISLLTRYDSLTPQQKRGKINYQTVYNKLNIFSFQLFYKMNQYQHDPFLYTTNKKIKDRLNEIQWKSSNIMMIDTQMNQQLLI